MNTLVRLLGAISISDEPPDPGGLLPFLALWGFSFICGASVFSFLSGRKEFGNAELISSFLTGVIIFGMLCLLSLHFSFFNYLPHISAIIAAILLAVRFQKLHFSISLEPRFLPFIILLIIPILTIPVRHTDALYYHAEITRIAVSAGEYPDNFGSGIGLGISSNYPPLFSMFNAFLLSGSGFSITLLGLSNAILMSFILLSIGFFRDVKGPMLGLLLVAWLFFILDADTSYPLQFLLFSTAFFFFDDYLRAQSPRNLALSAFFLGALSLVSYFGFFLAIFFTAYLVMSRKARLPDVALFCVILVVLPAPWLLRNFIISGNPVYPFLNQVFHSPLLSEPGFSFTMLHLSNDTLGNNIYLRFITLLFFIPFLPVAFLAMFSPGTRKLPAIHVGLLLSGVILIIALPIFFPRYLIYIAASALVLFSRAKESASEGNAGQDFIQADTAAVSSAIEWFSVIALFLMALTNSLIVPCFFCGPDVLNHFELYGYGKVPYYVNDHPEITSIIAFDMPTFFYKNATVVPFDEGRVFEPLLSIGDKDEQVCYLSRYSDYILLFNNQSARNSPFLSTRFFDNSSSHLELVHSFGNESFDRALYRITGCGMAGG